VNLSDLAAKGASLHSFSLSIGLGESVDDQWLETFAAGLQSDCKEYGISLSGGDTFKTGNTTVISITAFGLVPEGDYVSRLGTSVGDGLFVTGTIGDAALGLSILWGDIALNSEKDSLKLIERYHLPQPRVDQASLIRSFATASMDISDGLVGDMEKLCSASNVGAEITVEDVPLSDSAQSVISENPQLLETALTGGDDYEILFTVSQDKLSDFQKVAAKTNLSITQIGRISSGSQVVVLDGEGNSLSFQQPSYIHRS
jgi:thiamine-monophosphate kinase